MISPKLFPKPKAYKKRHRRKPRVGPPEPAVAPVLVAAVYDQGTLIDLTFDVPIDVSGLIPGAFIVFDGPGSMQYAGDGAPTIMSPTRILLGLVEVEPTGGAAVLLTVQTENGIIAVDGGAPYAGVAALEMPYP